jgi:hypothetical protein
VDEPGFLVNPEDSEAQRLARREAMKEIAARAARLEGIAVTRELTHKEVRQLEGWTSFLRRKEAGE